MLCTDRTATSQWSALGAMLCTDRQHSHITVVCIRRYVMYRQNSHITVVCIVRYVMYRQNSHVRKLGTQTDRLLERWLRCWQAGKHVGKSVGR